MGGRFCLYLRELPYVPRHSVGEGSYAGVVFYERGTPVPHNQDGRQISFACLEGDVMKTLTGAYTFKESGVRSTEVLHCQITPNLTRKGNEVKAFLVTKMITRFL